MSTSATGPEVSRHRRVHRRRIIAWTSVAIVGAAAAAGAGAFLMSASGGCTDPVTITVAVPPSNHQVIDQLARQWVAERSLVDGGCAAAMVVPHESAQVAAALGSGWNSDRDGERPNAWLPDSSLWLAVAASRPESAPVLADPPTSVAASPLVLGLRRPMAEALGWPGRQLTWLDVVMAFLRPDFWVAVGHPEWTALRFGATDPSTSTAGLASVLAILDQNATGSVGTEQLMAALGFSQVVGAVAAETHAFFEAQDPAASAGPNSIVAAFPVLERDLAAYNARSPAMPLVPVYASAHPVVADYPYVVFSGDWTTPAQRAAAEEFRRYLLAPESRLALGATGLRTPDLSGDAAAGLLTATAGFAAEIGPGRAVPDPAMLSQIMAEWAKLQRPANLLAIVDTSGSMTTPVPGSGLSRLALLQQIASTGLALLPRTMSFGMWEFSLRDGSASEYREIVPYGPVSGDVGNVPRRAVIMSAIPTMRADGYTPLYNTVYAAFQHVQKHWQANSTNAVLVLTDGVNEMDGGLDLATLLSRLKQEQLADQPVQIVSIALGEDADADALQQISAATGGRMFVVKDHASALQVMTLAFTGHLQ